MFASKNFFLAGGAAGPVTLTISANTTNYNIKTAVGGAYVSGSTTVNLTINAGVYVRSTSAATYALNTGTGWATGDVINIINNGYIAGLGGAGAAGGGYSPGNGGAGGPAIQLNYPVSITNASGFIYSGGGGGGGGVASDNGTPGGAGGYGAGAGAYGAGAGDAGEQGGNIGGAGGTGGAIGVAGGSGGPYTSGSGAGGGGGGGGGASGGGGGSGSSSGGGTTLAIQRNGNTCTFVSGAARVYGGIS